MTATTYRVDVDGLSLHDATSGASVHYERDHDLHLNTKAAQGGGELAAVVLVELGIDGYATHQVRLDFGLVYPMDGEDLFCYERTGDEVRALGDAIDALTTIRDQLAQNDCGQAAGAAHRAAGPPSLRPTCACSPTSRPAGSR